jgi:hypothetical protein
MTRSPDHHTGTCLLVVTLVCIYYVVIAPFFLGHYDLGWHIAAGDLIRHEGAVPLHDPWSFTAGSQEWFNLSWLWDVLQSVLLQFGGFTAIILETLLVGAAVAAVLFAVCIGEGAGPVAAGVAVFLSCMLYPTFAVPDIFLGATPGVITVLGCVVVYAACLRPRLLWVMPLVVAVWVNMHGGFIVGPCMVGLFMGIALLKREWRLGRRYLLFLALSVAATLVNPHGVFVYRGVLGTLGHFALDYITEWQPYFRVVAFPVTIPFCLFALLFAALELADRRGGPLAARLMCWGFLLAGLWKLRYLSIFLPLAALPVALHLTRLFPRALGRPVDDRKLGVAGLVVLACLPVLYWQSVPARPGFLAQTTPEEEIDYLSAHLPHARLLNHWNYGTFLIFRTRGAIPVFVDGRSATAYPDSVLRDYFPLSQWQVDPARWEKVLKKYDIDTIMWPKSHLALETFLTGQEGWTLAFAGPIANIYVRGTR